MLPSPPQITLVELVLDDDVSRFTITLPITDRVHLVVPKDIDDALLLAIVEAICRC